MRRWWLMLMELVMVAGIVGWLAYVWADRGSRPPDSINLKVQLRDAEDRVYLHRAASGELLYQVHLDNGQDQDLTPDEFARRVFHDQRDRGWLFTLLNIATPMGLLWLSVGLIGQVLFTGRMVVQWLISEKSKRSVVPPVFWWMSLVGATMLLAYFIWRQDPVGVLGQAVGWFIYIRNLWLIYSPPHAQVSVGQDPAPEPELGQQ